MIYIYGCIHIVYKLMLYYLSIKDSNFDRYGPLFLIGCVFISHVHGKNDYNQKSLVNIFFN